MKLSPTLPYVLLILSGSLLSAAEPEKKIELPQRPPSWALVQRNTATLRVTLLSFKPRQEAYTVLRPVEVTRVVNGQVEKLVKQVPETRVRTVMVPVATTMLAEKFKLRRVDGKPISKEAEARLKTTAAPAIVLHKGEKLDTFFRRILSPETLIAEIAEELPGVARPLAPPPARRPRPVPPSP